MTTNLILGKGLPVAIDAERAVLGAILRKPGLLVEAAAIVRLDDFSLTKHRTLFSRICDLSERGESITRTTLYYELAKHGEAESCDGLSYITSLDDGMPELSSAGPYARIVREKSLLRQAIFTSQKTIDRCLLGTDSPQEILAGAGEEILNLGCQAAPRAEMSGFRDFLDGYDGGLNALLNPSADESGTRTGFTKLDEMTGGLHAGELFILAARPSMGKTALCLDIARHVAERTGPVGIFSLEMTKESLWRRLLCSSARVDGQKYRAGFLNREERARLSAAAAELARHPIRIDDTASLTLQAVHATLKRMKAREGLALGVVDYLQLMATTGRVDNRNNEIAALSRGLKLVAKELDVPMLVLSQLSRAPEQRTGDHKPQLSDLRDSGAIEQDADVVGFIFRPEVYHPDRQDLRGVSELILAKQRQGPTGVVKLTFLKQYTRFENQIQDVPATWQDREGAE